MFVTGVEKDTLSGFYALCEGKKFLPPWKTDFDNDKENCSVSMQLRQQTRRLPQKTLLFLIELGIETQEIVEADEGEELASA